MLLNNLTYTRLWLYEGFYLEASFKGECLKNVSDLILSTKLINNTPEILATLLYQDNYSKKLNTQMIKAFCYTSCNIPQKAAHNNIKESSKGLLGKCCPSGELIYRQRFPNKKARQTHNNFFIHIFNLSLDQIYRQLRKENVTHTTFYFKPITGINRSINKKPTDDFYHRSRYFKNSMVPSL